MHDDRAGVALLSVVWWLLFAACGVAVTAVVTDVVVTRARARTAADAAALAAMAASPLVAGGDAPAVAAADLAAANGASVRAVDLDSWPLQVRVTVAVPASLAVVRAIAGELRASAGAQARPP